MRFAYAARLEHYPDDEIVVSFRDLPGCLTSGSTVAEALYEAEDALETYIFSDMLRGASIPLPSDPLPGEYMVALPMDTAVKAALAMAIRASGLDHMSIAKRLGLPDAKVRRMLREMLNPWHVSSVNEINEVLRTLGRQAVLEVQEISLEPEPEKADKPGPAVGVLAD